MRKFVSIKRDKADTLGVVDYLENGVAKSARFDKGWDDEKVCAVFGLERDEPEKTAKAGKEGKK